jgi:hypothetical protein
MAVRVFPTPAGPVSVTSRALRSRSLTAWSSDVRPINLVRGAGIEGIDPDGPTCSRRSSSRTTTEFWHHVIAFRSPAEITYAAVRVLVVGCGDFGSALAKSAARRVSR